ncbi:hypothetical protein [Homoserinibacter gongjuensis]|uniref:Uncharacterized protein n=1 Tax=Homoserinibacter gongjuensis TaxID=1162968 RepID=A0ABQ6JX85_9MICO|nr:hypothetical protein [Homoserinibacter gongjuensis]GMA91714.1 hypothetical protein GCM10025869_22430 [Homoserinibacter gongjuensis]
MGARTTCAAPPWLSGDLDPSLVDTRTKVVGRGLPPRDPSEPVFFPGGPPEHVSGWVLLLADGNRVIVEGPVVVGRKPFEVEGFRAPNCSPSKTVRRRFRRTMPSCCPMTAASSCST